MTAFDELREVYASLDAELKREGPVCVQRGLCCRFEDAGHSLYATDLEVDFAVDRSGPPPVPEAPGRCPYHRGGLCAAREGRPLGCRVYFCDPAFAARMPEIYEHHYARVRAIAEAAGYAHRYRPFPEAVRSRAEESGK